MSAGTVSQWPSWGTNNHDADAGVVQDPPASDEQRPVVADEPLVTADDVQHDGRTERATARTPSGHRRRTRRQATRAGREPQSLSPRTTIRHHSAEQLPGAVGDRRQAEELRLARTGGSSGAPASRRTAPRPARTCASSPRRSPRSSSVSGRSVNSWRRNSRKSQSVSRTCSRKSSLTTWWYDAPDHLAVPGVAAADLVALHDVDVVGRQRHQQGGLAASYCASPSV